MHPAAVWPATPAGWGEESAPPRGPERALLRLGAVRHFKGGARRQRDPPSGHVEVLSERQAGAGGRGARRELAPPVRGSLRESVVADRRLQERLIW